MTCVFDPDDIDSGRAIEWRRTEAGAWVRLWNRSPRCDDDMAYFCLAVGIDNELHAIAHEVWIGDGDARLANLLNGLVADFAGWTGVRTWRSAYGDLRLSAEFRSRGYVWLTWTIEADGYPYDGWQVSVPMIVEAGEEMRRLAATLTAFLDLHGEPNVAIRDKA